MDINSLLNEEDIEIKTKEKITTPNNHDTDENFRWHLNGASQVIGKDGNKYKKDYYVCASKDDGCPAKKDIHHIGSQNQVTYRHDHTHNVPAVPKVKPEVKRKVLDQLSVGAKPAAIHKRLVLDSPDTSRKFIPTFNQINGWKHGLTTQYLPSPNAFGNLTQCYGKIFMQRMEFFPTTTIVFISDFGSKILAKSKHVIIDGTFDLCEEKLILTTIMGYHDEVALPCAYMLSSSKEQKTYATFLKDVKAATNNRMNPQIVLVDFEEALSNAFEEVFTECMVANDFFHFQQANVKNLKKMKQSDETINEIVVYTRNLWESENKAEFDKNLNELVDKWKPIAPQYIAYFESTWIRRYKPEKWASFARSPEIPSGSNCLEGYHNRIQNHIFPSNPQEIDKMAFILYEEDKYFNCIVNDPKLWAEKKQMVMATAMKYQRQKRVTLKHYNPRVIELNDDDDEEEMIEQPKRKSPAINIDSEERCICGDYKINKSCSMKVCKRCCVRSSVHCMVSGHNKGKKYNKEPTKESVKESRNQETTSDNGNNKQHLAKVIATLSASIKNKFPVWISYKGGTRGLIPRKIQPHDWVKDKTKLEATCFAQQPYIKKHFLTSQIERIETREWTTDMVNEEEIVEDQSTQEDPSLAGPVAIENDEFNLLNWLKTIGLAQHNNALQDNGFTTVLSLRLLVEQDMDLIGITMLGHKRLLLEAIKQL